MKKIKLIGIILCVALIGNYTIKGWNWGIADFAMAAVLLFTTISIVEFANKKIKNPKLKMFTIIGLVLALMAIWAELAVSAVSKALDIIL